MEKGVHFILLLNQIVLVISKSVIHEKRLGIRVLYMRHQNPLLSRPILPKYSLVKTGPLSIILHFDILMNGFIFKT